MTTAAPGKQQLAYRVPKARQRSFFKRLVLESGCQPWHASILGPPTSQGHCQAQQADVRAHPQEAPTASAGDSAAALCLFHAVSWHF